MELKYSITENCIVRRLREYIILGMIHARKNNDLFPYLIGAYILAKLDDKYLLDVDYLKEKLGSIKSILCNHDDRLISNIRFVIEALLIYKLLYMYKTLNSEHKRMIKVVLEAIRSKKWLKSIDLASYVIFLLHDINGFSNIIKDAYDFLLEKINRPNSAFPSVIFGISFMPRKEDMNIVAEAITKFIGSFDENLLNIGKLSKLGIGLLNLRKTGLNIDDSLLYRIVEKLESLISSDICNDVIYDLERKLREAASLISAGFNDDEANRIIRDDHSAVSKAIEISNGKIILSSSAWYPHVPVEDLESYSFALWLLYLMKRDKCYIVNKKDWDKIQLAVKSLEDKVVHIEKKAAHYTRISSILFSILLIIQYYFLLLPFYFNFDINKFSSLIIFILENGNNYSKLMSILSSSLTTTSIFNVIFDILVIFIPLILLIAHIRCINIIFRKGMIDRYIVLRQIPILSWILKNLKVME